ncbi:MAG: hypothetical protein KJO69_02860 [Gammaproteobacteria bacterium]|nr:hypothetical protein [Gammaproteobacteria bacterium]
MISPPPSIIELVSNIKADAIWKNWLNLVSIEVNSFTAPSYTTTERNALTAVNGMIIYNTTTNVFNFYENGAWVTK